MSIYLIDLSEIFGTNENGRAPFGQHQESQPLRRSNTESLRMLSKSETITLHMFKKLELPEVAIHGADQKECCLWRL